MAASAVEVVVNRMPWIIGADMSWNMSGCLVVEVDVPSVPDKVESARASFEWVDTRPELLGARL